MISILTILVGILFVALVVRALFYTVLGLGQIALGLVIMFFSGIVGAVAKAIRKIKLWWYLYTKYRVHYFASTH